MHHKLTRGRVGSCHALFSLHTQRLDVNVFKRRSIEKERD